MTEHDLDIKSLIKGSSEMSHKSWINDEINFPYKLVYPYDGINDLFNRIITGAFYGKL